MSYMRYKHQYMHHRSYQEFIDFNVNAYGPMCMTDLMLATISRQFSKVLKLMKDRRIEYHTSVSLDISHLANLVKICNHCSYGFYYNEPKRLTNKKTPLDIACQSGHIKDVQKLLNNGVDVNTCHALYYASCGNHCDIVKLLINVWNIDVNKRCTGGKSPLMYASQYGNDNLVKRFLEKGADANIVDGEGNSALTLVCKRTRKKTEIAKLLLEAGANINHVDNNGYSALINAIMHSKKKRSSQIVQLLLDKGADPGQMTNDMTTALYYAFASSNNKIVMSLIEDKRSIQSTLFSVCYYGTDVLFNLTLSEFLSSVPNIDLNARDPLGLTPLMIATIRSQETVVQMLKKDRRVDCHKKVSLNALQIASLAQMIIKNDREKKYMNHLEKEMRRLIKHRQDEYRCALGLVMNRINRERMQQGQRDIPEDVIRDVIGSYL